MVERIRRRGTRRSAGTPLLVALGLAGSAFAWAPRDATAQPDWDAVAVGAAHVGGSVHVITGRGGNIGVSAGADGVFVIDDQYAPLAPRILAAIRGIHDGPIRFVLNTHWHGDHTGGNEAMGDAGALLVAHDNVRRRLSVEQVIERFGSEPGRVAPAPEAALPVVTFDSEVAFHMNGEEARVVHVPRAHTDGDAIVHFPESNVVHMGDTFFNGMYPFIDVSSGGSVDGFLAAQGRGLSLMDAGTRVIPGHGPVADREALRAQRDVLRTIRDRVARAKAAGLSFEEALAEGPTADFDERYGGGFISPEALVHAIWVSLPGGSG